MKVIFLDIDGVLISERSHAAYGGKGGLMESGDPTAAALLRRLCREAPASLVVSSHWRSNWERTRRLLTCHGLARYLHPDPATPRLDGPRAKEIEAWLGQHSEVAAHAILDDGKDAGGSTLCLCTWTDGLTLEAYNCACKLLGVKRSAILEVR